MMRILKLWLYTMAELVMASFVLLLTAFLFFGGVQCSFWILTLPVYSLIGLVLRKALPKHILTQFLIGIPLCIILTWLTVQFFPANDRSGGMILGVCVSIFLFWRARKFLEADWASLLPTFVSFGMMLLNFCVLFVVSVAPAMEPLSPYITAVGPFVILINLLSMNTLHLHAVTESDVSSNIKNKVAVSKGIGLQNRTLLFIIFLLVLIVSLWKNMMKWFNSITSAIAALVGWLIDFFYTETTSSETGSTTGSSGEMLPSDEVVHNPIFERIMEILIVVVAVLGVIAFVVFIGYQVYRLTKEWWPKLMEFLKRYISFDNSLNEYTDSKEKLLNLKDLPKNYMKRAADWISDKLWREKKWEELATVEEKVRFLYRRAVRQGMAKGTAYNVAKTPTETLDGLTPSVTSVEAGEILKTYYNNVRYGGILPTETEVNDLYRKLSV